MQSSETGMEKQVWVQYQVSGPTKTPFENTHISGKTIYGHKYIEYSSTEQPNVPGLWVHLYFLPEYSNLKIVNMVFEAD